MKYIILMLFISLDALSTVGSELVEGVSDYPWVYLKEAWVKGVKIALVHTAGTSEHLRAMASLIFKDSPLSTPKATFLRCSHIRIFNSDSQNQH